MANLSTVELRRIERQFAEGIKSGVVVDIFKGKGHRFSEATLRKYVQLGLLPQSRRVGVRGRHRGSSGLYPVGIVKLINDIKLALDAGATLEQVRLSTVGLASEVQSLRKTTDAVLVRFGEAVASLESKNRPGFSKQLVRAKRALQRDAAELDKLAARLGKVAGGRQ